MDSKAFDFAEYTRIAISCPKDGVLHRNTPKPVGLAVAAAHARFETKVKFGHIPSTLLRDQHSCTSKQKLVLRRTETMVATLGDPAKLDSKLYTVAIQQLERCPVLRQPFALVSHIAAQYATQLIERFRMQSSTDNGESRAHIRGNALAI